MTTVTNRRVIRERFARVLTLGLLAFAAALYSAPEAQAQWVTSGTTTTTTNSVGIGTTTPSQMFHVHSAGAWAGTRVTTAATGLTINDGVHFGYDDGYGAYVWNREATPVILSTSNTERMRIDAGGNVGIGVGAPASKFHLRDTDTTADNEMLLETTAGNFGPTLRLKSSIAGQGADFLLTATAANNAGGAGAFRIYDYTANATRLFIAPTSGNVGIGTTEPGSKMVISSNAANPLAPNPANPSVLAPQDGTILHIVNADTQKTRVTIDSFNNTAGPSVAFRAGRGTLAAPAATQTGDAVGIVYGGGFGTTRFHAGAKPAMWMVATENWTDTAAGSAIFFNTVRNGTTATVERMRINGDGNVGIGTTAPATALHVAGDIRVDGNISAKYQDVAEWVPSTQALAAGTVVALDTARSNHVVASAAAYDTRVAGVVSAQPGLALGEGGEGKVLVATTGRVKIKVDATRAPISIGDLLVTSDVPGVAMKSESFAVGGRRIHAPGTIIGKALEPLGKGTGEILVLLSLQ